MICMHAVRQRAIAGDVRLIVPLYRQANITPCASTATTAETVGEGIPRRTRRSSPLGSLPKRLPAFSPTGLLSSLACRFDWPRRCFVRAAGPSFSNP